MTRRLGCQAADLFAAIAPFPFPGAMSECEQYNQCDNEVKVELCSVTGVADLPSLGHILYFNTDDIDLSQRAWDFMAAFSLDGPTPVPALPSGRWMLVLSMIWAATSTLTGKR
jgi:poly(3-hydroxybutyrate) depolymerase